MIKSVDAICNGGVFCECGGLMVASGGCLLSNPPKQKVECPFCGSCDYVTYPYVVDIQFKLKKPQ